MKLLYNHFPKLDSDSSISVEYKCPRNTLCAQKSNTAADEIKSKANNKMPLPINASWTAAGDLCHDDVSIKSALSHDDDCKKVNHVGTRNPPIGQPIDKMFNSTLAALHEQNWYGNYVRDLGCLNEKENLARLLNKPSNHCSQVKDANNNIIERYNNKIQLSWPKSHGHSVREEIMFIPDFNEDRMSFELGSVSDGEDIKLHNNEPLDLTIKKSESTSNNISPSSSDYLTSEPNHDGNSDSSNILDRDSQSTESESWLKKIRTGTRCRVRNPKSYEFLLRLLQDPNSNPSMIRWEDEKRGIFRLVRKDEISRIWGMRSNKHKRASLSYDNFARNLRYHYKTKMMVPVSEKHLVYRFGENILESIRNGYLAPNLD